VEAIGPEVMASLEQMVMLQTIDTAWKDHLLSMDHLKEGIGLRGYGQRDPLREYQREGYEMFVELIERIKEQTVANLMRVQLAREEDVAALTAPQERPIFFSHGGEEGPAPKKRESKKIGRNDPCTCGSGKKYKKCCGRNK
jgi:preprotein translocase subunit SecA